MSCLSKAFPCFFPKKPIETESQSQSAHPKPNSNHNQNHESEQPQARSAEVTPPPQNGEVAANNPTSKPVGAASAAFAAAQEASRTPKPVGADQEAISDEDVNLIPAQPETTQGKSKSDDLNNKLEGSAMSLSKDAMAKPAPSGQHMGIVGEVGVLAGGVLGGGHVSSQMASSTSSRRDSSHRASPLGDGTGGGSTPSVFEPRATPRTVFQKAPGGGHATFSSNNAQGDKENNIPASRPSRPAQQIEHKFNTQKPIDEHAPSMQDSVNSVSDWISIDQMPTPKRNPQSGAGSFVQQQSKRLNEQNHSGPLTPTHTSVPSTPALAGYKQLTYEDSAEAAPEVMVRDGDVKCEPGTKVVVSKKWLDVPYFEQFAGRVGVLTRRGLNGVMWYASFPGIIEQAFATGMHGQHVLAYASPAAAAAAASSSSAVASPAPPSASSAGGAPPLPSRESPAERAVVGTAAERLRGQAAARSAAAVPMPSTKDPPRDEGRQGGFDQGQRHALPPRPTGGGGGGGGQHGGGLQHTEGPQRGREWGGGGESVVQVEMRARDAERGRQLRAQAALEHAAQQRQPPNKDAVQDASVAVATDAPLAAPRGGKRSARGPLSARDKLSVRPPSARSRSQMGAPPLGSGRRPGPSPAVSARRPGGTATPDMGMSPREEWTPDSPREGGRDGRLFKYPEWDEYELFDSDDLWSEHAYLLYGESMGAGQAPSVFVWVGQYFEEAEYGDEASCERFALHAAHDFRRAFNAAPIGPVTVVKELEEEEDFWEYFVLG